MVKRAGSGSVETIDKWKKNRVLGYIGYFENQGNAFYKMDKTSMVERGLW
jgi:hypothetical protein